MSMFSDACSYLACDWPWMVVLAVVVMAVLWAPLSYPARPRFEILYEIFLGALLVISFFMPFTLPVMALWGDDFWSPLVGFVAGFVAMIAAAGRGASEGGIIFSIHLTLLYFMVLLAVALRFLKMLIGF